ncbi:MAG: pyridoxal phosphate-dependent aminotransferase [Acidobacteria bacterium]|nr:MAG: pyridoxal phosphate-dependent aminotransferase [Acidobacteriota bacterium]
MFSARTGWNLAANRLSSLRAAKRRGGARVLDLTETNPTRVGIAYPPDLLAPLADPGSLRYEPAPRGLEPARRTVAEDCRRRGAAADPARIILASSTSEAYAWLFKLLCDPGDAVLVPRPSYPLFDYLARLESVDTSPYPLSYDGEWHLSLEAVARAITPRTRALVLVSPNNPTGSYVKRVEAEQLLALCAERGLAVVSDEVFADYAFAPDPRRAPSLAGDGPALAFSLGGLSKSCGLPQLKLAWIAVGGPESLRRAALERLEVVADTYLSVSTPVQRAAPALLARRSELQGPIARRVSANLDALRRRLQGGSSASVLQVEGGWSAVLQVPATESEEDRVIRLLEEHDVLVHPGYFFDFAGEAYLVLSLLPPPAEFAQAVDRILGVL